MFLVSAGRSFGLDILRACAILLVVFEHLDWGPYNNLKARSILGLMGVELFFVLSGFLIGRIILELDLKNGKGLFAVNKAAFINFYLRRWTRTLPLYYLAFIVFEIVHAVRYQSIEIHWAYILFLQNAFPDSKGFFAVSWSLAIEEWFYLILPWLIYLLVSFKFTKKNILACLIGLTGMLVLIRSVYILTVDTTFDESVRKSVIFHLDPLLTGVILALIKKRHKTFFKKLNDYRLFISALVINLFFAGYFIYLNVNSLVNESFFIKAVGLNLTAVCMAVIIGYADQNKIINKRLIRKKIIFTLFTFISLLSYSIYIWHYEINRYLYYLFSILLNISLPLIIIAPATTMVVSFFSYKFIEIPFLKLRNISKRS